MRLVFYALERNVLRASLLHQTDIGVLLINGVIPLPLEKLQILLLSLVGLLRLISLLDFLLPEGGLCERLPLFILLFKEFVDGILNRILLLDFLLSHK